MMKHKKIIGTVLTLMILLSCFTGIFSVSAKINPIPTEPGSVLTDGQYIVTDTTVITATEPGQSGLVIAEGAEVEIFINKNATLNVTGADGLDKVGGGAGIYIPEGAKLTVSGYGTLLARGGDAGNGGNGTNGQDGRSRIDDDDKAYGGAGGNGGNGGGGAGAGIGGTGGTGGTGGKGGAGVSVNDADTVVWCFGINASDGGNGGKGTPMGELYLCNVTYTAVGGTDGTRGADGKCGKCSYYEYGLFSDTSYGAGGGAGEGGNPGKHGFGIGPGGGGGAGGAGGGSGAALCNFKLKVTNPTKGGIGGYHTPTDMVFPEMVEFDENKTLIYNLTGGYSGITGMDGYSFSDPNVTLHTHIFSSRWSYDDDAHWLSCLRSDCFLTDYSTCLYNEVSYGAHVDRNDDCICDVCGRLDAEKKNLTDTKKAAIDGLYQIMGDEPSDKCVSIVNAAVFYINDADTPDKVAEVYEEYSAKLTAQLEAEEAAVVFAKAKAETLDELKIMAGTTPSEVMQDLIAQITDSVNTAESYAELKDAKEHGMILIISQLSRETSDASAEKLTAIEGELDEIKSTLDEIKNTLEQMNTVLGIKQAELEGKEDEIAQLRSDINEKNAQLASINNELASKEAERAKAITALRESAVAEITAVVGSNASAQVKAAAYDARTAIEAASTVEGIQSARQAGLEKIAQIKAAESADTPTEPDKPAVCEKCGHNHANNFFGKIACLFYRFINLFK